MKKTLTKADIVERIYESTDKNRVDVKNVVEKLLEIMKNTGKSVKELSEGLFIYPQLLKNVKVNDKTRALNDKALKEVVDDVAKELGDEGRILVRPSGTEPLIRVMVEAKTDDLCAQYVDRVVEFVEKNNY